MRCGRTKKPAPLARDGLLVTCRRRSAAGGASRRVKGYWIANCTSVKTTVAPAVADVRVIVAAPAVVVPNLPAPINAVLAVNASSIASEMLLLAPVPAKPAGIVTVVVLAIPVIVTVVVEAFVALAADKAPPPITWIVHSSATAAAPAVAGTPSLLIKVASPAATRPSLAAISPVKETLMTQPLVSVKVSLSPVIAYVTPVSLLLKYRLLSLLGCWSPSLRL